MPFAHTHPSGHTVSGRRNRPRLHHLRRKRSRIRSKIPHHRFEIRSLRSRRKRGPAPVMQHRTRQLGTRWRSYLLDDHLAPPQPRLAGSLLRRARQKSLRRPMLPRQPTLNRPDIRIEDRNRRSRSLCKSTPWTRQDPSQSARHQQ
jgi:hypothetical protein